MKLISLNIEGDKHLVARIFPFLEQERADVLCLQEVFQQDLLKIAKTTALSDYVFVPQANISQNNPHLPVKGDWGLAIFAKELSNVQQQYYVGQPDLVPEFFANNDPNSMNRLLLSAVVNVAGQDFQIATTHFTWSGAGEISDLQLQNFKRLEKQLDQFKDLILCGDFNTPRGGEIFDRLAEKYQDNVPQDLDTTIDGNMHKSGKDIRLVVDGLFTSKKYSVSKVKVVSGVSDHMAVVADINRV